MRTQQNDAAWQRGSGLALAFGASVLAVVTWLERFFGPTVDLDPDAALVAPGAVPIHVASFVAFLFVVVGLTTLAAIQPTATARVSALGLAAGLWLGVLPHTVLDFSAIPIVFDELPRAEAVTLTNRLYDVIGPLAIIGGLLAIVSLVVLSLATRRTGVLPRWAWMSGLASVPVAIALGALVGLLPALPVPHPPVALDLAVAVFGLALYRSASGDQSLRRGGAAASPRPAVRESA